jgi:hypothetical protein
LYFGGACSNKFHEEEHEGGGIGKKGLKEKDERVRVKDYQSRY